MYNKNTWKKRLFRIGINVYADIYFLTRGGDGKGINNYKFN